MLAIIALALGNGGSVGIMFGVQGVILSELFATSTRFSGAAISREIGAVLFGGLAPFISVSLSSAAGGIEWPVGLYVIGLCTVTLIAGFLLPETCRRRLDSLDDVVEHRAPNPVHAASVGAR